jgi:hypothetical protein
LYFGASSGRIWLKIEELFLEHQKLYQAQYLPPVDCQQNKVPP